MTMPAAAKLPSMPSPFGARAAPKLPEAVKDEEPKTKKVTIKIKTKSGEESVKATVDSTVPIAWHPSIEGGVWAWTVTHIPTGHAVYHMTTEKAAAQLGKMLRNVPIPETSDPEKCIAQFTVIDGFVDFLHAAARVCEGQEQANDSRLVKAFLQRGKKPAA
jgi:hypothetical protein